MKEIQFMSVPKKLNKELLKEKRRIEIVKKSTEHPFVKNFCKRRLDLICELLYGKIKE